MFAIETTRPRPHREDIGAIIGGAMLVAYAVNAIGDMTGFGFVGAGYLMSGLIGAGCLLFLLWKTSEGSPDLWRHPSSAWPIAAAFVCYSTFRGFDYMAIQTNPVLFEASLGLGRGVEARFLPFYASLNFKLGGFGAIAALRLLQAASSRGS